MIDNIKLKQELQTDPLSLNYNQYLINGNHVNVASLLNAKNYDYYRILNSKELLLWSAQNGRYVNIEKFSDNALQTNEYRSIAKAALALINRETTELDLNRADVTAMLEALIMLNVLTISDKIELLSLAKIKISRAEQLFGLGTTIHHLDIAGAI